MLYLPSALSKVTTRSLCATNDCCLLVSRTLPVSLSLKRAPVGGCRSRPSFAVVSVFFSAQFWTNEILNFYYCSFFLWRSSGFTFGDSWRLSSGLTYGDNVTFAVIQLSV